MNFPMMYRHELFEEMPVIIKELFLEQKLDVDNICKRVSKMLKE